MITPQTGLLLLSATAITLVIGVVFVLFIRKISFSSLIYQAKGIRKNRSRSFSIAVITPQADSAAQNPARGVPWHHKPPYHHAGDTYQSHHQPRAQTFSAALSD